MGFAPIGVSEQWSTGVMGYKLSAYGENISPFALCLGPDTGDIHHPSTPSLHVY
jgi:hypothetical protein